MATAVAVDPQELVRSAIKSISSIATLPEVTVKIIKTVEDPRSTASKLHQIIAHDPALVTRILKVVNSAFYGLPGQIGSIERAIVLLGLNAVKNISVAASIGQLFRGAKLCEGFTARDLWTHCIGVGVAARDIAKQLKVQYTDEAFLAGMIHDIGLLVSLQTSPEKLRTVCERARGESRDFCELEREIMGVDHQMLGKGLAEHWKFPVSCQQVAGYHHNPSELAESSRTLVHIVNIADALCCQSGKGFNLTALRTDPLEAAQSAGIDAAIVEQTRGNLPGLVECAASLFN